MGFRAGFKRRASTCPSTEAVSSITPIRVYAVGVSYPAGVITRGVHTSRAPHAGLARPQARGGGAEVAGRGHRGRCQGRRSAPQRRRHRMVRSEPSTAAVSPSAHVARATLSSRSRLRRTQRPSLNGYLLCHWQSATARPPRTSKLSTEDWSGNENGRRCRTLAAAREPVRSRSVQHISTSRFSTKPSGSVRRRSAR